MVKKISVLLVLAISALDLLSADNRREELLAGATEQGVPSFSYNIFRTLSENRENFLINVHIAISNDRLQFIKEDDIYRSSYSVSVGVFKDRDTDAVPVDQISEVHKIKTRKYKETLSYDQDRTHGYEFEMKKGIYTVIVVLKDINSDKSHTVRSVIEFNDDSDIIISDLRMVFWEDDERFEETYEPLINNIVDKQSLYTGALLEIQNPSPFPVTYEIDYRIINIEGNSVYNDGFVAKTKDKLHYQVLKIPLENLKAGNYKIKAELHISDKTFIRDAIFYLRWKDLSLNVSDIDKALEQMLYIVDYDSMEYVFDLEEEEKRTWFKKYWNDLEGSLSLKKNSLMEEYFRRITYSNVHFSVPKKEGWKTDMGKVLCLMGDPDEVQNYPFINNQKPYEVWIYYDINAQFIFDYTGGEYRLRR
ncbi:MAG: GWxTD domain-containing protein [Candidatus Delongbacteria bacterium]